MGFSTINHRFGGTSLKRLFGGTSHYGNPIWLQINHGNDPISGAAGARKRTWKSPLVMRWELAATREILWLKRLLIGFLYRFYRVFIWFTMVYYSWLYLEFAETMFFYCNGTFATGESVGSWVANPVACCGSWLIHRWLASWKPIGYTSWWQVVGLLI